MGGLGGIPGVVFLFGRCTQPSGTEWSPKSWISESSFYRILHKRGLLERMEHDFVLAADELVPL
jgi:helix-turn-helix domain protein (fragment)